MKHLLKLLKGNTTLLASIEKCEKQVTPILDNYITNFPDYTDHTINHSKKVLEYSEHVLASEIKKLTQDEVYILIMAGFLHDIGMNPTTDMKKKIKESEEFKSSNKSFEDYLRWIHHELSYEYITRHWKKLGIVNEVYAEAIALVGMGHRVVDLLDFDRYNPEFPVQSGSEYVCLPYLAAILRLSDELDITNDRTPELLFDEYLPDNKVSKREWEKHKANYFVNFSKQTIKITSKCENKELYFALQKQYGKIEEILKYCLKVVNTLPQNDRGLKIEFVKLEKDIKTIGFVPKQIGFTFDLQNTINTFIGKNIYKDKFVAIRECLQNAIDTCLYRKNITKEEYKPEINVTLENNKLIIADNGVGMDDFIIENYFSKLAKSYYTESKVVREFEAISQFGIGVFSYFLLCDYFEVDTKKEGKPAVKFRATKDAQNFFHFYDKSSKQTTGTTITIFLNNELLFDELLKQIKHYIRFVEFPININHKERSEIVSKNQFLLDKFEMLEEKIDRYHKDNLEKLVTINAKIDNEEFEGELGLLIGKDEQGYYFPIKNYDELKTYDTSKIEISQKGIFVGDYKERRLDNVIGKINLKKKNDIDLGRYNITSHKIIEKVCDEFYKIILAQIFDNWEPLNQSSKQSRSSLLIGYYFSKYSRLDLNFLNEFLPKFCFKVYESGKMKYFTFNELIQLTSFLIYNDRTPFFSNRTYSTSNYSEVYEENKIPLVVEEWAPPAAFILDIFKSRNNYISVHLSAKHWYYIIKPKEKATYLQQSNCLEPNFNSYPFDCSHLCAKTDLWVERAFNLNHKIIQYYITYFKEINQQQESFSLFVEFLKEIDRFTSDFHSSSSDIKNPTSEVIFLNSILTKINAVRGTQFQLSNEDFPIWMNEKIKWDET